MKSETASNNVKGILDFANCRNILLVNSSPTTYNVEDYRYTYLLSKDGRSNTQVVPLLTYNKIEKMSGSIFTVAMARQVLKMLSGDPISYVRF